MKRILLVLLIALLVVSPGTAWLSGYQFRMSHVVNGSSSMTGDATSIEIPYWLHNATGTSDGSVGYLPGVMYSDWRDLQPTDENDNPIPYYIEMYEPERARVWVSHPTIADGGSETIYFYWGNPDASKKSDGEATFVFYDHFDGYMVDVWKWQATNASISNSVVNLTDGSLVRISYNGYTVSNLDDLQHEIGYRTYANMPMSSSFSTMGHNGATGVAEFRFNGTVNEFDYVQNNPDYYQNTGFDDTGWNWFAHERWRDGVNRIWINDDGVVGMNAGATNQTLGWAVSTHGTESGYLDYMFIYNTTSYPYTHGSWSEVEENIPIEPPNYPPHTVEFFIRDNNGLPLANINVTAVPESTSMGTWGWLQSLFGIDADVEFNNTAMTGFTGNDGVVTFSMSEVIKYRLTLTNATQGVSDTYDLFPKDEVYIIQVDTTDVPADVGELSDTVSWYINATGNDTYMTLGYEYYDTGDATSFVWWNVTNSTGSILDTSNKTLSGLTCNDTYGFTTGNDDTTYTYKFEAYHPTFGWVNQTGYYVDHKEIELLSLIPEGPYRSFVGFAIAGLFGLIWSKRNWKEGSLLFICISMLLAMGGVVTINGSKTVAMTVLGALLVFAVFLYIKGMGDNDG